MAFLDLLAPTLRPMEGFSTSHVETPGPWPVRTFLPIHYEPRYAYPLLVWFHGEGGNEEQMLRLAPRLSRRNFIGISLRAPVCMGPRPHGQGWSWADGAHASLVEDYLLRAVEQTRRRHHVHSERIYLAGYGDGAAAAYRLALTFPEKLAGVVALNGVLPRVNRPLLRMPDVRTLRVFIGHGIANAIVPLSLARADQRLLYAAGVDVEMHTYPTTHKLHPDMLRDLNRWIIEHCNREYAAA
jgi:phospholipase/carboxylesterase